MLSRIAALPAEKQAALLQMLKLQRTKVEPPPGHYDLAILGGGVAGLTLALQLKNSRPDIRILVTERQKHPVPEAAHKVGESTVEIAAHYLRDILGLDDHLQSQQLRKFGLRMFFSNHDNQDLARRVELGSSVFPPLCTYQLDRGRLENELGLRIRAAGTEFLDESKVLEVELRPEQDYHRVLISHNGAEQDVYARWIVDATGRSHLLRRQLNLGKKVGHAANAVWFRVGHPIDVKEWTDDPDWHTRIRQGDRALSTNHLMGAGYWVWLIRLASGSISIGIVTDANMHSFEEMNKFERAMDWLRKHEPQCARAIEPHLDKIQDFRVMKDYSYGCRQVYSGEGRWCLTGEAGVFLDPLYSPGLDMIAISNGLITDLVTRSLAGEDVRGLASVHDRAFLSVVDIWLAIYEKQYTLMGNPQVVISKIIWDTAFYWGVFGLLFFHDKFRTMVDSPSVTGSLARLTVLSNRVQAFYREWEAIDQCDLAEGLVDLYEPLNFMVKLHHGMAAGLSPAAFDAQFAENVKLFEQLAGQLVSTVIEAYANRTDNPEVFAQIQQWQTDPLISTLISTYRREGKRNPTSDGWMTLARKPVVLRVENEQEGETIHERSIGFATTVRNAG
jgi:flavin-dependent dehydrogenase